jgi:pilus assembly protein Flp/PilA
LIQTRDLVATDCTPLCSPRWEKLGRMDITPGIATLVRWAADSLRAARRRDDDERGQGMVEYALILVLIAIVVIVILQVVGAQVNNVFSNVSNGLAQ